MQGVGHWGRRPLRFYFPGNTCLWRPGGSHAPALLPKDNVPPGGSCPLRCGKRFLSPQASAPLPPHAAGRASRPYAMSLVPQRARGGGLRVSFARAKRCLRHCQRYMQKIPPLPVNKTTRRDLLMQASLSVSGRRYTRHQRKTVHRRCRQVQILRHFGSVAPLDRAPFSEWTCRGANPPLGKKRFLKWLFSPLPAIAARHAPQPSRKAQNFPPAVFTVPAFSRAPLPPFSAVRQYTGSMSSRLIGERSPA